MAGELEDIGTRLREERDRVGISQRELARRIGLSASMISQIESGQSKPSVSTLYAIVRRAGGLGRRHLSRTRGLTRRPRHHRNAGPRDSGPERDPVVHPDDRHVIDLDSGVRWERLTTHDHEDVDFLHVIYDVGGSSAGDNVVMRHPGREYGYILSGHLGLQLGFEQHKLGPGDSIGFDSTTPHRLWNLGEEPVHGIWFVVSNGRLRTNARLRARLTANEHRD